MSLAVQVERYVERLDVTQGAGAGKRLALFPWEQRWLRGALKPGRRTAALTIGRGCGKTTLCGAIACSALDGPLAVPRGEVVLVASSFSQARIGFEHIAAFLRDRVQDRAAWRIINNSNTAVVEYKPTGARVRAIASDPRRAHGLAPVLVLADEPAQWPRTSRDAMLAALKTGLGKVSGSRFWALGTRPAGADHWFQKMLDGGADYAQVHAASPDDPIGQRRTWLKANPSLPYMPDLEEAIRAEAAEAKRDPAALASFRALRLNLGEADIERHLLLDAGVWESIEGEAALDGGYVLGVDLGGSAAMSAAVGYWPVTGALRAVAAFPEVPTLAERGLRDGVGSLYADLHARGDLILAGRRVPDVPALMGAALEGWGRPEAIVADRWREAELRQALEAASFPSAALVLRGQGWRDGAEDVRRFRTACLAGRVTPRLSMLMRFALQDAGTVTDGAGNAKLQKLRARARDDAAAAAVLAVAEGERNRSRFDRPARRYRSTLVR